MNLRRAPVAVAALAVPVAAWALLPFTVSLGQDVDPALPVDAGLLVPEYGDAGTYALDYRHHDEVTLTVPVHNRGPLPLRITEADLAEEELPLLVQVGDNLPLKVSPWGETDLTLTLRFDNCRYYHERSAETWDQVEVIGSVLGRDFEETVTLGRPIVLHGQVINDCPDRTLRRGDDVRPR
ncbi:hypothetical protein [Nocardioides antri]|uniref:Uncharacterized protein n=1 Tax=Nocardioides antri TaxID=2607659 RepID=A0A5B1M495_9ACTN|nr:hypothetical protein [Nocardioides antri]KAA1427584.1 hypothetical protein F0U47_09000 [Nocardioides antri]